MPSADNLCKKFGSRSSPTFYSLDLDHFVGPDLDSKCLTLWWYSDGILSKSWYWKNQMTKKHAKFSRRKRVKNILYFQVSEQKLWIWLNLEQLLLSADNLCKQFGPRPELTVWIQTDWHPECVPERVFLKKLILKKISRWQQRHEKLHSMQRVKNFHTYLSIGRPHLGHLL